jgi:CHAT domain-containing protein
VDEIGNLFISKRKRVRSFAGKGLHLDSLLALGGQSRIFHLATHGYKDPDHYEFSGWMMSGEPAPSPAISNTTNRIELGALQSFRMESDLVVMSSCSIGADPGNSWYKMIGFPNNFFHAGVRNMLFSLWDVSDKHTKIFMSSFYRKVLDGNSYSSALREAKLKMISDPETTFPTIWAVFVLWSD